MGYENAQGFQASIARKCIKARLICSSSEFLKLRALDVKV